MSYAFEVLESAEQDVDEAYQWYEERRAGLGEEFLLCLDAAFARIQRSPLMYRVIHEGVRRAILRRFPYGVLYFIEEESIRVISVFHFSRDPEVWQLRRDQLSP